MLLFTYIVEIHAVVREGCGLDEKWADELELQSGPGA